MTRRNSLDVSSLLSLAATFGLGAAAITATAAGQASTSSSSTQNKPDAQVELIPRQVFFGNPDRASVTLSPDGEHLAYLAPKDGVLNVWVRSIEKDDARPVTTADERPIRTYFWAENSDQIIYAQDRGGDENFQLFAVNVGDGKEVELTPFDGVQARVLATDRNFPDEILAAINNRIPQLHDVYRINTRTGERELVHENEEGWVGFVADANFNVRLAMRMNERGGMDAYMRHDAESDWESLASWDQVDTMTSGPLGFSRDGETLYFRDSRQADTGGLYAGTFDPEGELKLELVARNDLADISDAVIDPDTGKPQAVAFEYARTQWELLDPAIRVDWKVLSEVCGGDFSITSRTRDDSLWTVAYVVDDGPVRYYLYDRDSRTTEFLFTNRSPLEGLPLSKMKPEVITARDGLKLVSYLTLPRGRKAENLPMVLLVHGGPWARDSWGYNPLHQWLANRGYAVLSVNFRSSTGFGKSFVNAGDREWSGKMHDDLIDAVNWAIEEGIADPERVAIMGGSYGGYATLVGLTFTPEVFAAGVDIVGPSHVRTLLESIPPYWEPVKVIFETRVGALSEPEYLDAISPLTKVDEITRPLLIGQGANDPRVKQAESEQIVEAMQSRDIPVTYVLFPDEGHGFARPENSQAFFAVTEAFLSEHLGGRYEPFESVIRQSSAKVPAGVDLVPELKNAIGE